MLFCCLLKAIQLISLAKNLSTDSVCTDVSLWQQVFGMNADVSTLKSFQQMLCNVSTFNMTKAVEELYAQYPDLHTLILLNVCIIKQLERFY